MLPSCSQQAALGVSHQHCRCGSTHAYGQHTVGSSMLAACPGRKPPHRPLSRHGTPPPPATHKQVSTPQVNASHLMCRSVSSIMFFPSNRMSVTVPGCAAGPSPWWSSGWVGSAASAAARWPPLISTHCREEHRGERAWWAYRARGEEEAWRAREQEAAQLRTMAVPCCQVSAWPAQNWRAWSQPSTAAQRSQPRPYTPSAEAPKQPGAALSTTAHMASLLHCACMMQLHPVRVTRTKAPGSSSSVQAGAPGGRIGAVPRLQPSWPLRSGWGGHLLGKRGWGNLHPSYVFIVHANITGWGYGSGWPVRDV